ncbi:MAG: hypothetical protein AAF264_07650, partial [Pseudomonadota bacterium]
MLLTSPAHSAEADVNCGIEDHVLHVSQSHCHRTGWATGSEPGWRRAGGRRVHLGSSHLMLEKALRHRRGARRWHGGLRPWCRAEKDVTGVKMIGSRIDR